MSGAKRDCIILWLTGWFVAGCGGATPPPTSAGDPDSSDQSAVASSAEPPGPAQQPDPPPAADLPGGTDSGPGDEDGSDAEPTPEESATDEAEPGKDEAPEEPAPPQPAPRPSDIVTAVNVIYILNYQSSDLARAARDKCDGEAGEDMQRRAKCLAAEREKFRADAFRFKRDSKGKRLTWTIYRRDGSALKEIYVARCQFADESDREVAVVPRGGKGARPLFQGRQKVVLGVPSTYEVIIEDPRHGRLVYKARFDKTAK